VPRLPPHAADISSQHRGCQARARADRAPASPVFCGHGARGPRGAAPRTAPDIRHVGGSPNEWTASVGAVRRCRSTPGRAGAARGV